MISIIVSIISNGIRRSDLFAIGSLKDLYESHRPFTKKRKNAVVTAKILLFLDRL